MPAYFPKDFLLTAHFKNLRKPHLLYPHIFPTTLQLSTVEYSFSNHFTLLSLVYIQRRVRRVYRLKITFKILPIQHVSDT